MKYIVVACFVLFSAACVSETPSTESATGTGVASASADYTVKLDQIEQNFKELDGRRDKGVGWELEVRPGSARSAEDVSRSLFELRLLKGDLENLPTSDRQAGLDQSVYLAMVDEAHLLFRIARQRQDIWTLDRFLDEARDLDIGPDQFGVELEVLRVESLAMAKKFVADARPFNSDTSGAVATILRKWNFTPKELGLTAEETKALGIN